LSQVVNGGICPTNTDYVTVWRQLKQWSEEGIWDMIVDFLKDNSYPRGQIFFGIVAVDSSFVEAKRGQSVEYNGFKKRKEIKIHDRG
jgi:hypothetical protein